MAKRSKADTSPDDVAPLTGEPLVEPQVQLPEEQRDQPRGEDEGAPGPAEEEGKARISGSGLGPYDHWSREGELAGIRSTPGRPDPTAVPEGSASPEVEVGRTDQPVQQAGTDKHYAEPADAKQADVDAALGASQEEAPPPFRKRDGFPDITTESVNVRLVQDYYPLDPSRYGNQIRAYSGQLVAFPPDEALALIDAGIAVRADDDDLPGLERHGVPLEPPQDEKKP